MHHFIYPSQDTFITNQTGLDSLNFGLNEVLYIGTNSSTIKTISPTTTLPITQSVSMFYTPYFYGFITGSLYGTSSISNGIISSSTIAELSVFNFSGIITRLHIFKF